MAGHQYSFDSLGTLKNSVSRARVDVRQMIGFVRDNTPEAFDAVHLAYDFIGLSESEQYAKARMAAQCMQGVSDRLEEIRVILSALGSHVKAAEDAVDEHRAKLTHGRTTAPTLKI